MAEKWDHPRLSRGDFIARLAKLREEEAEQPESWWWLSFAGDEGFRGVAIVRARGGMTAIDRAAELGINPGGQVQFFQCDDESIEADVPAEHREVLLTKQQLEELKLI